MKVKFEDIEEAFDFVSFGLHGDHTALLDKSTGKIHYHSESGDMDEIPEEMWESDDSVQIPHKNDLGLGNQLVFEFIASRSPEDCTHIRGMFSRKGAYARYKEFLHSKGILQQWYDYEQEAQRKALHEWCKENGIEVTD